MSSTSTKPRTEIALLVSTSTASMSSSDKSTKLPLPYSYPFTMSFCSTGSLHTGHMYGRLRGVLHFAWRVVNRRSFSSVAPYTLIGMFTRPNVIAPDQTARAIGESHAGAEYKGTGPGAETDGRLSRR